MERFLKNYEEKMPLFIILKDLANKFRGSRDCLFGVEVDLEGN